MIPARLAKALDERGFSLEFPGYDSDEELIVDILRQGDPRLDMAIPLLLQRAFDYKRTVSGLDGGQRKRFHKIMLVSERLFRQERLERAHLRELIREHGLRAKVSDEESASYRDAFREALRKGAEREEERFGEETELREALRTNEALAALFSPGKRRIMENIYRHEQLTNTELKYYYRAIRPLCRAILNHNLQRYCHLIETTKKYHERT